MFYDVNPFPWWGPGGFGGINGVQVPEEVPLTVDPNGKPLRSGGLTSRQSLFSPSNPQYGPITNTDYSSGPISSLDAARDSNSTNALGAMKRATRRITSNYYNYRRMRADGIVAIGREFADALICTAQWTYEKCDENVDEEWVDAVHDMWEGRGLVGESHEGYSLREFFLSESCRARDHGNHTLEIVYGDDDDGLTTVDEFLPCLPENTRPLVFANTRKFAGVRNWGVNGAQVDLEPAYCVRFIYDGEGGDLFGRSRFENCKDWIQVKWEIRDKIRTDLNISIGNIMKVGYPVDDNNDSAKTLQNEQKGATIGISLAKGLCVTYPTFSTKTMLSLAQAGIDVTKLDTWKINRLDTGTNSFDGFKAAVDLVDEQILFGLLTLPRAVREADHGSKADSEQHTDSMVSMVWRWITYVSGIAQNITDTILVQRFGLGAKGQVRVKPVPLSDESKAILSQIFTQLLSDKSLALKVLDIKSGLEKLQVKTLPDFDQEELAAQMDQAAEAAGLGDVLSSREKMRRGGYKEQDISRIQKEKATEDAIPMDEDKLGGA
jgi:hypothetical protein